MEKPDARMGRGGVCIPYVLAAALARRLAPASAPAMSQTSGGGWPLINGNIRKRVNAALTLMTHTLFPAVTTSTLSITSEASGNP